jgi:purine-nucleoside/S-methyl-5'-thioadenosine phosphorylase / adenosine deaminase
MDMIQSAVLTRFAWVEHRFGTRAAPVSQDGMATLKQIHSARCLVVSSPGCAGEADALITDRPGVALSIRTADCFPILLADPEHRAVAAVHAGWRGTEQEIVGRTLDAMCSDFDTSPAQIAVAIGPGIGACCYEVGDDVARRFGLTGAGRIDLAAINREQLIRAGVPASRIDTLGHCTRCESESFHSYRRDREQAGRMISFIRILAG